MRPWLVFFGVCLLMVPYAILCTEWFWGKWFTFWDRRNRRRTDKYTDGRIH